MKNNQEVRQKQILNRLGARLDAYNLCYKRALQMHANRVNIA